MQRWMDWFSSSLDWVNNCQNYKRQKVLKKIYYIFRYEAILKTNNSRFSQWSNAKWYILLIPSCEWRPSRRRFYHYFHFFSPFHPPGGWRKHHLVPFFFRTVALWFSFVLLIIFFLDVAISLCEFNWFLSSIFLITRFYDVIYTFFFINTISVIFDLN